MDGDEKTHPPKTPRSRPLYSHIPKPSPIKQTPEPVPLSHSNVRPAVKSWPQSPMKAVFLNKDSNISFPAWEDPAAVSKRLEGMTEMMEKMASQMEGTTFEKKGMAEVLELYKAKGRS